MNRRLFIPSAAPAILTGFVLWATCLVSAWYIHRLQSNMSAVLSQDVEEIEAGGGEAHLFETFAGGAEGSPICAL